MKPTCAKLFESPTLRVEPDLVIWSLRGRREGEKKERRKGKKARKELETRRWVSWCVGWELSFYTAHLKARATPAVTLGSQRQVDCLCLKSRSLDSSERWQAELTRISDYILPGQRFVPITCTQTDTTKPKENKIQVEKIFLGVKVLIFLTVKFMLLH